ncbi:MAG: cytochrome P460 family protein [Myxococcota bacterium]
MPRRPSVVLLVPALLLASATLAASPARIPFPAGYRDWTHVKSMWLGPDHALATPFAGLHHVYVNDTGRAALEAGRPLPDGAILVFDLLEAPLADAAVAEGPRKLVGVMTKDRAAYPATGGWGFEAFAGDSTTARLVTDGGASCFACHQARQPSDYVFTAWRR